MVLLLRRLGLVALTLIAASAAAQTGWLPLASGTTADLHAVHFATPTAGYVAGTAGTVLRTVDGGTTWTAVSPATGADLYGVYAFDAATAVVVGGGGAAFRTTNGGATWAAVPSGTTDALYSVAFAGSAGIAGAGSQTILRSADGGASWTVSRDGFFGGGFYGADMLTATRGAVAGINTIFQPMVGVTADGGATFTFTPFYFQNNEGRLSDVHLVDATTVVAVGVTFDGNGATARSADGGATFTTALYPGAPLYGLDFGSPLAGVAVGGGGAILATTDGGQAWAAQASGTTRDLRAVATPSGGAAFAVGDGGTVLRRAGTTAAAAVPEATGLRLDVPRPNPSAGPTALVYSTPGSVRAS